jgi:hypothetical protein
MARWARRRDESCKYNGVHYRRLRSGLHGPTGQNLAATWGMLWRLIRLSTVVLTTLVSIAVVDVAADKRESRASVMQRAQLWQATNISEINFAEGPRGRGAFAPGQTVRCRFLDKKLSGNSPKFACVIGADDEVKVKYGGTNGEVYAELLATRLLWALGFGADRMYRVNVICDGCPLEFNGIARTGGESRFAPALIERKMNGEEWDGEGESGWSFRELEQLQPEAGGAPRHQRDALKLLAVMLQHTDTKPQQQRIMCLGAKSGDSCDQPFLMLSDVGLTFGRASATNANDTSGANLVEWRKTPVWRDEPGCVGNLSKSLTGTLEHPVIGEHGRAFLAGLLSRLSDRQLTDLFESAAVTLRLREPGSARSGFASVGEWVETFKEKRQQILDRRCA